MPGASTKADPPSEEMPTQAQTQTQTLTQRICRRVLSTAQSVDATATISSVARLEENNDATLVRLRAGSSSKFDPASLIAVLRSAWPLAHVSVVENVIEGTHEAQVVVPSTHEQREIAHAIVSRREWAGRMATLGTALVWASAATFGGIVVAHLALE
jgi:hypothetical protein